MSGRWAQIPCQGFPQPTCPVPSNGLCSNVHVISRSGELEMNFLPSQPWSLLGLHGPCGPGRRSSRFYPPVRYRLSQAGTSSLLRIHLPPHTASEDLESPLVPSWTPSGFGRAGARLPQLLRVSREQPHPQSQYRSDQVWGFATFSTLTHLHCRIWFACAVCRSLPIASFRPCRYRQRPCNSDCLPPGRGDACFLQQAG